MDWVGSQVLPHEADVRAWLRRSLDPDDLDDIVQEAYCRISALDSVDHIRNGRAYLFTTARALVFERLRRAKIVNIETVTEIDTLNIVYDEPTPEQVASGRRELARVRQLIEGLPEPGRRILKLRKIEGWSQRAVAEELGVPEHIVENHVARGLRRILKAIAEGEQSSERALADMDEDERARDSRGH